MQKIFDIHTHIYPHAIAEKAVTSLEKFYEFERYYDFYPSGNGTFDHLRETSLASGVCGALMLCVATNEKQVEHVNDFMAKTVSENSTSDFTLVGFGGIHQDHKNIVGECCRIEELGLKGIKLHPDIQGVDIDDKRLMAMYEAVEGKLPIYFHIGDFREQYRFSQPRRLAAVKKRFPRLEVVAAHLGGYSEWDNVNMLADLDGIWFDTSSALWAMDAKKATDLVHTLGSKRVMFGTDYPVACAHEELRRFYELDLDRQEQDDILYNNAKRFLKL